MSISPIHNQYWTDFTSGNRTGLISPAGVRELRKVAISSISGYPPLDPGYLPGGRFGSVWGLLGARNRLVWRPWPYPGQTSIPARFRDPKLTPNRLVWGPVWEPESSSLGAGFPTFRPATCTLKTGALSPGGNRALFHQNLSTFFIKI